MVIKSEKLSIAANGTETVSVRHTNMPVQNLTVIVSSGGREVSDIKYSTKLCGTVVSTASGTFTGPGPMMVVASVTGSEVLPPLHLLGPTGLEVEVENSGEESVNLVVCITAQTIPLHL